MGVSCRVRNVLLPGVLLSLGKHIRERRRYRSCATDGLLSFPQKKGETGPFCRDLLLKVWCYCVFWSFGGYEC